MTALLISRLRFGIDFGFHHITVAPFGSRTREGFVFKPTRRSAAAVHFSSAGTLVRIQAPGRRDTVNPRGGLLRSGVEYTVKSLVPNAYYSLRCAEATADGNAASLDAKSTPGCSCAAIGKEATLLADRGGVVHFSAPAGPGCEIVLTQSARETHVEEV